MRGSTSGGSGTSGTGSGVAVEANRPSFPRL